MEAPESTGLTFSALLTLSLAWISRAFRRASTWMWLETCCRKREFMSPPPRQLMCPQPSALHGSLPTLENGLCVGEGGGVTLPAQFTLSLAVPHKGEMICFFPLVSQKGSLTLINRRTRKPREVGASPIPLGRPLQTHLLPCARLPCPELDVACNQLIPTCRNTTTSQWGELECGLLPLPTLGGDLE